MVSPERSARRPVDAQALARHARRLQQASDPPWLHGEVAMRMADRLPLIKLKPDRIVEWHVFTGASHDLLRQAYPQAAIVGVEPDDSRREATVLRWQRPWWSPQTWRTGAFDVVLPDSIAPGQAGLLWSNMALQGVEDPQAAMRHWHAALQVDGFLMFSTLGPGSLPELAALYVEQGWPAPFAPFVDMHDLGDMLIEAGFADPVMDQEMLTLTWPSAAAALTELRSMGGNAALQRASGLRTPRWRQRLIDRLEQRSGPGQPVALAFEVVYGHAFKAGPRALVAPRTELPLEDMRAMVRSRRGRT